MTSLHSDFQKPTQVITDNCWCPVYVYVPPWPWLFQCILTQPPTANTCISLNDGFPWPRSARVHRSWELSSPKGNPHLKTNTCWGKTPRLMFSSPQHGIHRHTGQLSWWHALIAVFLFPISLHFPPVFPEIIPKKNQKTVCTQIRVCFSCDSCQGLCTNEDNSPPDEVLNTGGSICCHSVKLQWRILFVLCHVW